MLQDVSAYDQRRIELRAGADANAALKRRLEDEITDLRSLLAPLVSERSELAAFCAGTYDLPEYQARKARCDVELPELDRRIAEVQRKFDELMALEQQRAASAKALAEQAGRLGKERSALILAITGFPGIGDPASCIDGPGWAPCIRELVCDAVRARADRTRKAIERSRNDIAASQRELDFWTRMNGEAQKGALLAGTKFLLGQYAANTASSAAKLEKLRREADRLSKKYGQSRKGGVRTMYMRQLRDTVAKMSAPTRDLVARVGVNRALTAEEQWSVIRNTLKTEFNAASQRDAEVIKLIQSSQFKAAFQGDGIETAEWDLLASLAEDAARSVGEHLLNVEQYAASVAPAVRAFDFARDATYNGLLSALSTQRVLQQADLAGDLARASAILQERYEDDVLDAAACAAVGPPIALRPP